jgi:hypothetical protein
MEQSIGISAKKLKTDLREHERAGLAKGKTLKGKARRGEDQQR